MHPSRQAYVEEAESEVSKILRLQPSQARRQYSYDPRRTTRHDTASAKGDHEADRYGATSRTQVLTWQTSVSTYTRSRP